MFVQVNIHLRNLRKNTACEETVVNFECPNKCLASIGSDEHKQGDQYYPLAPVRADPNKPVADEAY